MTEKREREGGTEKTACLGVFVWRHPIMRVDYDEPMTRDTFAVTNDGNAEKRLYMLAVEFRYIWLEYCSYFYFYSLIVSKALSKGACLSLTSCNEPLQSRD